mmetsp:Transcript_72294/g.151023  ORF Transcript_72294/g.151023 Transcript_72294/m.151023 type:complete len:575 (+) Transcript_72294:36-1760(+)|eukprot:CAMPEP_0181322056 /NCGR_PEP_ID=MMETSP1101-20121128/19025_1 /TAXON_ID=46948 /ORGANISM="Rhodomonas abbreviata, Strain Caron Lab Isolate" /LENGTH=574 /DNA_ID=CAMNT_0023429945 /DNA_START=17 /DNA_END=1741 /DNA_ORIENTATION=+
MSDGPSIRVKFTIKCKDLNGNDGDKVANPICIVKSKKGKDGDWEELGRTECLTLRIGKEDIEFVTKIVADYEFECKTYLQFNVMKVEDASDVDGSASYVCGLESSIGRIVSARGSLFEGKLVGEVEGGEYGSLHIFTEEVKGGEDESLELTLKGKNILNKDGMFNGGSDPYIILKRTRADGQVEELHRTEFLKNTSNPEWATFSEPLVKLCNGDLTSTIRIECWDDDGYSKDDPIGNVECTIKDLLTKSELQLKDYKEGRNLDPGIIVIAKAELLPRVRTPTFLDYVRGGMKISLSCAVDFTASNQPAKYPRSLHSLAKNDEGEFNEYQRGIESVGEVLVQYAGDATVTAVGYGGQPKGTRSKSHCFPLAGEEKFEVEGIAELLEAYKFSVQNVRLSGPTNFAEVIAHSEAKAKEGGDDNYHVLLILTDGAISDKKETAQAIVSAAEAPMSIIIVGVGKANFGAMEKLDGDEMQLKDASGNEATRDIVQFVPLRKFDGDASALATEVLKELPGQILQHFCRKQIKPKAWDFVMPEGDWAAASGSREITLGVPPHLAFLFADVDPEAEAAEEEEE